MKLMDRIRVIFGGRKRERNERLFVVILLDKDLNEDDD